MSFLPVSMEDIKERGLGSIDFLYISGDAYVDHPAFGHAIISRLLEKEGYNVAILPQPDYKTCDDFKKLGRPRLGVLISSGVIDSMVNHYTATRKPRSEDLYSPGGKKGMRPDRALIVYCNRVREAFGDIPIIIGGIEASLRRFAHYDYWENRVRRSVLLDCRADILIYGAGEAPIVEIARLLEKGVPVKKISNIRGTCVVKDIDGVSALKQMWEKDSKDCIDIFSFEEVRDDKVKYAKAFMEQYREQDYIYGKPIIQKHFERYLVQNPPSKPLTEKEMDKIYSLPYERAYHPMYEKFGGIPALTEVKFSLVSHRGCFGGCSFCALNFHFGRVIQKRSSESIIQEARKLMYLQDFRGYIHDVGGPTANFRNKSCKNQEKSGVCKHRQCLYPTPCKNLEVSHKEYNSILEKIREIPGIKKVFIRSGIRYDYLMIDKDTKFFENLCTHHISGQLKVAPEHICADVLEHMGKPQSKIYFDFVKKYFEINKKLNKEQYLVPYLMSGHPGSTLASAIKLAEYLKEINFIPKQVQDFYPTPGTISTTMYYTGIDPKSMKKVYVPISEEEKKMQRALLQFDRKENYNDILKALTMQNRLDLIGFTSKCLIRPKGRFIDKPYLTKASNKKVSSKKNLRMKKKK